MSRLSNLIFGICVALGLTGFVRAEDWVDVFNGKDLTGWKANVSPEAYSVVNGVLVVHDTSRSPVDDRQWFEMDIVVNHRRIVVSVNGKVVVDYTEPSNPERAESRKLRVLDPHGGALAVQAHDAASTWYFKEIKIRRLPDYPG